MHKEKVEEMVKKMDPHMAIDLEQRRAIVEKFAVSCRVAYEKLENERFEEEDYSMSKKLVLGLDYMDSVEYLLFWLDDLNEFMKISALKRLLMHGKPINHDRLWLLRELSVGNFDEATLIAKINDFGDRANAYINFLDISIKPIDKLINDLKSENTDV